ncbi:MAG: hypothetical protein HY204_11520 [Nitrospirae bacterium]|nr:hypothetical protein [Nitrospirota bacterium]
MQGFYPIIAFGVILFYMAVVLVIFMYALMIRLLPMQAKIPVVSGSLKRFKAWFR